MPVIFARRPQGRQTGAHHIGFPKPDGYDPRQDELLFRIYDAGWRETFDKFDPIPNRKTDSNNHGPFSTDNIGFNYDYPEASYDRQREILKEHETYRASVRGCGRSWNGSHQFHHRFPEQPNPDPVPARVAHADDNEIVAGDDDRALAARPGGPIG